MILCDIGNSTFSFLTDKDKFVFNVDEHIKNLPTFENEKIYFISVNKKATKKFKQKYKKAVDIKSFIHLDSKYDGLGIDRAINCAYLQDGIIVDAGSAITIDVMDNSKHLGGFILPGFNAYQNLYPKISSKLKFSYSKKLKLNRLPLKTNDAINYAIIKPIILMIKDLKDNYDKPIFITGGNAYILIKYLDMNFNYKPKLIFKAMKQLIKKEIKE